MSQVLIPADAFYEWKKIGKSKEPYCFEVNEAELFAFAGIWDHWKNTGGNSLETCSILTTTPNAVTAVVHDRMPVILHPDSYDLWLACFQMLEFGAASRDRKARDSENRQVIDLSRILQYPQSLKRLQCRIHCTFIVLWFH
jgi:putative SOS response-associated peptidase YedK